MKLPVHLISEGENIYQFKIATDPELKKLAESLETQGHIFKNPLEFEARLARVNSDFLLRGTLKFALEHSCARCTESFLTPFTVPFELALHYTEKKSPKVKVKIEEDSDEVDIIYFAGPELNLTPYVQEQFLLSLPFNPLCKEGCKGLCQECGGNRNEHTCNCIPAAGFHPFSTLKDKA